MAKRSRSGRRNQGSDPVAGTGGSGPLDPDGTVRNIMAAEILQQYSFDGAADGDRDLHVRFLRRQRRIFPSGMFSAGITGFIHGADTVDNQRHTDDPT